MKGGKIPIISIAEGYSDEDMQPVDMQHPDAGVKLLNPGSWNLPRLAEASTTWKTRLTTQTNDLAAQAYSEAAKKYGELSMEDRKNTNVSALAMEIFMNMPQESPQPPDSPSQSESGIRDSQLDPLNPGVANSQKTAIKAEADVPSFGETSKSSGSHFTSVVRDTSQRKTLAEHLESLLKIPDLADKPFDPDVVVTFSGRSFDESFETSFRVHWASAVKDDTIEQPVLLTFVVDSRDRNALAGIPQIEPRPEVDMQVTIKAGGDLHEFTAVQSFLRFDFGIFTFLVVMGVN